MLPQPPSRPHRGQPATYPPIGRKKAKLLMQRFMSEKFVEKDIADIVNYEERITDKKVIKAKEEKAWRTE